MFYRKSLIKEMTKISIGVFFVLFLILISTQFINLLGKAADGKVSLDILNTMITVSVMSLLPLLLILTVFITVLNVFTRYWSDGEMPIWLSSGISLKKWVRPVLYFIFPFFLMNLALSIWLIPWINERGIEFSELIKAKPSLSFIEQGVFIPIPQGIVYVEEFNTMTGKAKNYFSYEVDEVSGKSTVTLSKEADLKIKSGQIHLSLDNANRYIGFPHRPDYNTLEIKKVEYNILPNEVKERQKEADRKNTATTKELWESSSSLFKSILMWRLSMPIAILLLAILAIPLSYQNKKVSKNWGLLLAVFLFFLYYNSLIFSKNLISSGSVSFWIGLILPHTILMFIIVFLFKFRMAPSTTVFNFILNGIRFKK